MTRKARRAAIVQERVLPATPEEVFAAWSDAESLSVWMCPGDVERADVEIDFRVGGRFRIVMHGEQDYVQHGEYLEIEPPKRLSFTWVSDFVPAEESRTRVKLSFEAIGTGRTLLRLVHEALPDKLHETAYAIACDIVAADLSASQEELRLLEMLRHRLDVDRLAAAAIERGARARHMTL